MDQLEIKKVIGILNRIEENKCRYLKEFDFSSDAKQTQCCFSSNDDGTYTPICEGGVRVSSPVVYRWLESSEHCPFCGLLSGTVR